MWQNKISEICVYISHQFDESKNCMHQLKKQQVVSVIIKYHRHYSVLLNSNIIENAPVARSNLYISTIACKFPADLFSRIRNRSKQFQSNFHSTCSPTDHQNPSSSCQGHRRVRRRTFDCRISSTFHKHRDRKFGIHHSPKREHPPTAEHLVSSQRCSPRE